ncbi:uroporphyrinogen-III synthase [Microvirga sp. KLBC 81]|uniref:uroporphyrinogen-III synthase n=1 Tax=Microvirga sp. KLBC 81 TaxID=1862707 RepID=UPI001402C788|nr:uroporphyrinogen-III synthase [Microvirga sp. KLBC 81]
MRVLVTRAKEDAERTEQKLAALGHEALIAPVLRITPTDDPAPAGSCDAVVVTSAHAVEALSSHADKSVPIFAVGERTAEVLRAEGFASVMAAEGDAASLSRLIRETLQPPLTLLHVTGRHHKEEPASSLRAARFKVLTWEAYEAQAVESLPDEAVEAFRTGEIGAALHYSRRSADLLVRLAERAGLHTAIRECPHLCLSADVAAPLRAAGAAIRVADQPDEDALLKLVMSLS